MTSDNKVSQMHFAYRGFTQDHERRCFTFWSTQLTPVNVFSIEIDLALFFRNRVPVQDGPMFCLQLLTTALLSGPSGLERFHKYEVGEADFRPLLVERERKAAEKAMHKAPRKPFRKPSWRSNVALGTVLKAQ